jgi:heme/copper-type cytochrome/quinol oxidase subunit 2
MPVVSDAFLNSKKRTLLSDALDLDRADQVSDNSAMYKHILSGFKTSYKNNDTVYGYNDFTNISRWLKRSQGTPAPVRFLKLPITSETTDLFDIRFYASESTVQPKPTPHTTFLTMKQKRYARKKTIFPRTIYYRDELGKKSKRVKMSGNLLLYNNELIMSNFGDANKQYRFFRKNKKRYENTSVLLSRRLLRTRRTLVLPAHVNLTAVTNSYDVIHSWFIPGLGLKLDCIPGRATHHTFYIDNVGFYYGQCAEICGRYHHHMPIRICALPFEHFLV